MSSIKGVKKNWISLAGSTILLLMLLILFNFPIVKADVGMPSFDFAMSADDQAIMAFATAEAVEIENEKDNIKQRAITIENVFMHCNETAAYPYQLPCHLKGRRPHGRGQLEPVTVIIIPQSGPFDSSNLQNYSGPRNIYSHLPIYITYDLAVDLVFQPWHPTRWQQQGRYYSYKGGLKIWLNWDILLPTLLRPRVIPPLMIYEEESWFTNEWLAFAAVITDIYQDALAFGFNEKQDMARCHHQQSYCTAVFVPPGSKSMSITKQ